MYHKQAVFVSKILNLTSINTMKSHGQRSLAGYSPWGRKRIGYDLAINNSHIKKVKEGLLWWSSG